MNSKIVSLFTKLKIIKLKIIIILAFKSNSTIKIAHTNMLNKKHTYMDDLSTYFTT